jgi:hypothetical protein
MATIHNTAISLLRLTGHTNITAVIPPETSAARRATPDMLKDDFDAALEIIPSVVT